MQEASADATGAGGWIVVAALVVGFTVRVVKSERLDEWLDNMGLPAIPKRFLPWLALGLGLVSGVLEALASGRPWPEAAWSAFYGVMSGALAVAGNETLGQAVANASPKVGRVVFAKAPTEGKAK